MRRRGYTPRRSETFASARVSQKPIVLLSTHSLNLYSQRPKPSLAETHGVLDPLKVVLTNLDNPTSVDADLWPHDIPKDGTRSSHFRTRNLYRPRGFPRGCAKGFFRLKPGGEVRLRHGYVIKCDEVIKDATGQVTELRCSVDLATLALTQKDVK